MPKMLITYLEPLNLYCFCGVHIYYIRFDRQFHWFGLVNMYLQKKGKRKDQRVPQSQAAALPRHQEEEETDKTKQAQIEQTYIKH